MNKFAAASSSTSAAASASTATSASAPTSAASASTTTSGTSSSNVSACIKQILLSFSFHFTEFHVVFLLVEAEIKKLKADLEEANKRYDKVNQLLQERTKEVSRLIINGDCIETLHFRLTS